MIRIPRDARDEGLLQERGFYRTTSSGSVRGMEAIDTPDVEDRPVPKKTWVQLVWSKQWALITAQAFSLLLIGGGASFPYEEPLGECQTQPLGSGQRRGRGQMGAGCSGGH